MMERRSDSRISVVGLLVMTQQAEPARRTVENIMASLFVSLLAMSPPENGIAIAEFAEKWEQVQISKGITVAKGAFVGAVKQTVDFAPLSQDNDSGRGDVQFPAVARDFAARTLQCYAEVGPNNLGFRPHLVTDILSEHSDAACRRLTGGLYCDLYSLG
jgi:hypothetical protein